MFYFLYFLTLATGIAIFYTIVIFAVYNFGGWQNMELRYKASRIFRNGKLRLGTVTLGSTRYRNTVKLGINKEGLYIKPMFSLIFHKALFIRWADVEYAELHSQIMGQYLKIKVDGYKFKLGMNYYVWEEIQVLGIEIPLQAKS